MTEKYVTAPMPVQLTNTPADEVTHLRRNVMARTRGTVAAPYVPQIDDRVRITDYGVVRKVNLSSGGEAQAVLVECEGSGDATWVVPGMLEKVSA